MVLAYYPVLAHQIEKIVSATMTEMVTANNGAGSNQIICYQISICKVILPNLDNRLLYLDLREIIAKD